MIASDWCFLITNMFMLSLDFCSDCNHIVIFTDGKSKKFILTLLSEHKLHPNIHSLCKPHYHTTVNHHHHFTRLINSGNGFFL